MRHEWEQVLEQVAAACFSQAARRHIRDARPLSREEAERVLRAVGEAGTLYDTGVRIFNYDLDRVSDATDRFDRDEPLEAIDYRIIGDLLEQVRAAKMTVARQTWVKEIALLFDRYDPDLSLEMTIKQTIDKNGEIVSEASPELARVRRHLAETHARIAREIKNLIVDPATGGMLQEDYFTIRDDRYVLPFKTQFKRIVKGVIHNFSRSGQTAFLEPLSLVEQNNRLSLLAAEEDAEIRKILRELRGLLGRKRASLAEALGHALHLESLYARDRWMRDNGCAIPEFVEPGAAVTIEEAWYPPVLAAMGDKKTVRNDFSFREGERIMVVSGPNAGGKTVALKTFFSVAELARCGIPVPAKRAVIPFFDAIFLVLGDQQDANEGESSFSAHLRNLSDISHRADDRSLVLIDEIGTGTDPQQGGAIARAFLEFLRDKGCSTLVTSHLAEVKSVALEDPAFVPVAMGFDEKRDRPTYRFIYNLVGGSNALALVRQIDFPAPFVRNLEKLLSTRESSVEPLLNRLRRKEEELDAEKERIDDLKEETARQKGEIDQLHRKLARKERDFEKERLAMLKKLAELEEAQLRRRVEKIEEKRLGERIAVVRKEKEQLAQAIEREKAKQDETAGVPLAQAEGVRPGETIVYDKLMKIKGTLSALKGKQAEITAGGKIVTVPMERLIVIEEKATRKVRALRPVADAAQIERCDVRGMTAEEACRTIDKAVDGAYTAHVFSLIVIHGHGTGILKKAVREHLATLNAHYPLVARKAPPEQGGDGATLVEFK